MADALQALDMVVVLEEIMGAYARNSKVMKRSSRRSTVMDEANMMEKAMNLVAKKKIRWSQVIVYLSHLFQIPNIVARNYQPRSFFGHR